MKRMKEKTMKNNEESYNNAFRNRVRIYTLHTHDSGYMVLVLGSFLFPVTSCQSQSVQPIRVYRESYTEKSVQPSISGVLGDEERGVSNDYYNYNRAPKRRGPKRLTAINATSLFQSLPHPALPLSPSGSLFRYVVYRRTISIIDIPWNFCIEISTLPVARASMNIIEDLLLI